MSAATTRESITSSRPLGEIAGAIADVLAAAGVTTPHVDARWIVHGITGVDPERFPATRLRAEDVAVLQRAVVRRARREPLQLVLGTTAFLDLEIACVPGVFVPRPETEVLALVAADLATSYGPRPQVIELCTGSGALACVLASRVPGLDLVAADISTDAVALARQNLDRLDEQGAFARDVTVAVTRTDLFDGVEPRRAGRVDLVVANPPYLPRGEHDQWPVEVRDHDPIDALIGGLHGHEIVERILDDARDWLRPGGAIVLEIDARRSDGVTSFASRTGYRSVRLRRDLTGADRVVTAVWPGQRHGHH